MQELEKLLNSLIQRGWKPAGFPGESEIKISEDQDVVLYMNTEDVTLAVKVKLRNLVSLESGLWQFVCQNKLLSDKVDMQDYVEDSYWFRRCPFDTNWMYRIMQSALYSEKDLPQFLVENIIITCQE